MPKTIPNEILTPFLRSYEKGDIWQLHSGDRWLTVWLYTNSQIEHNKDLPIYQQIREEYYKLAVKYLDLKISNAENISISFESKENFETKYKSNWGYYYH